MKSQRLTKHRASTVASEWIQDCKDPDAKKERIEYLQNSTPLFDQLRTMLQRRYDAASATSVTDYDSASWSFKQAHQNGVRQTLEEIYKLLP